MILTFIVFAAALFIDGATDSANSVTAAVSSKALTLKSAVILSSLLTFAGCAFFCLSFPLVAESSADAVSFPEGSAPCAVICSLLSVSIWSGAAWVLGLPTSEGHGLISASCGAALALGGSVFVPRLLKIFLSILPAAALGALLSVLFSHLTKKMKNPSFRAPIIASAAVSSFFHGAQDGQKFLALALSASLITDDNRAPAVLSAALFMAFGTFFGGRIIRKMGNEMANADRAAALSSDLGSAAALAALTFLGIPASTTHIKMTSLVAATRALGGRSNKGTFALLIAAWVATFPVCITLGFLLSKLYYAIFL